MYVKSFLLIVSVHFASLVWVFVICVDSWSLHIHMYFNATRYYSYTPIFNKCCYVNTVYKLIIWFMIFVFIFHFRRNLVFFSLFLFLSCFHFLKASPFKSTFHINLILKKKPLKTNKMSRGFDKNTVNQLLFVISFICDLSVWNNPLRLIFATEGTFLTNTKQN